MATTRDQLAVINFGYISGFNLLQYCPEELLLQKYNQLQYLFQQGCNQAYSDLKSRLASLYDLNNVLSNASQILKKQTGSLVVNFLATSYVSQINFKASEFNVPGTSIPGIIDIDSYVSVGTTVGGTDLLNNQQIGTKGFLWYFNKYYNSETNIYLAITGPAIDIKISSNIQSSATPTPTQQLVANLVKDDLLIEILSKLSIKKILGSAAGTNKQLQAIFDENENVIVEILEKVRSLNLPAAPRSISQLPHVVNSSFNTIG
jgi:hypothetical protein